MKRVTFGVDGFTVLYTDVHATAYTAVSTGRTYPFVRGFLFGYFSEDRVINEGVFLLFDV
jgi:hypothetical protein